MTTKNLQSKKNKGLISKTAHNDSGEEGFIKPTRIEALIGETKKFILGYDYENPFENGVIPEVNDEEKKAYKRYQKWIVYASIVMCIVYLGMGIAYVSVAATRTNPQFQASLFTFFSSSLFVDMPNFFGSYYLWCVFTVVPFLSGLLCLYPVFRAYYFKNEDSDLFGMDDDDDDGGTKKSPTSEPKKKKETGYFVEILLVGVDWYMWTEMALVNGFVIWCTAQISGIMDIMVLLFLILLNILFCFVGGLGMEVANSGITAHTSRSLPKDTATSGPNAGKSRVTDILRINWWPFLFGALLPVLILIMLLFTYITYTQRSTGSGLYIQWVIVSVLCLMYLLLIVLMFARYVLAPRIYFEDISKEKVEKRFINGNGIYKLAKSGIYGLQKLFIIVAFFVELFLL